jgi:hypothetical protein
MADDLSLILLAAPGDSSAGKAVQASDLRLRRKYGFWVPDILSSGSPSNALIPVQIGTGETVDTLSAYVDTPTGTGALVVTFIVVTLSSGATAATLGTVTIAQGAHTATPSSITPRAIATTEGVRMQVTTTDGVAAGLSGMVS